MIVECPNTIECPCDETLMNLSVEVDDFLTFACIRYAAPPPDIRLTYGIPIQCLGFCTSTLSEDDACLCAMREAIDCTGCTAHNAFQFCVVTCLDGTTVLRWVLAGTYSACTQAEADAKAASAACLKTTEDCPADHQTFGSDPFCCEKDCPDGRHVVECVPADFIWAATKEEANRLAHEYGCHLADLDCGGTPKHPAISCTVFCPDGSPFTYTLPAGVWMGDPYLGSTYVCGLAKRLQLCLSNIPGCTCDGSAYLETISASGGGLTASPLRMWEIVSGALPPGLTFMGGFTGDNFVIIQGTPTTQGTYSFTVRLTTQSGLSVIKAYTVCVIGLSAITDTATVGIAYSDVPLVPGCTGPFTYSMTGGALPPGLTFDPATGVISGTPTTAGTYDFTIEVESNCPDPFNPPPIPPLPTDDVPDSDFIKITTNALLPDADIGIFYSKQLVAINAKGPVKWIVAGGGLPPGLNLDTVTGLLSGTPQVWEGTAKPLIRVQNQPYGSDEIEFTLNVAYQFDITTAPNLNADTGVNFSAMLTAVTMFSPVTWSLASGTLPVGITLNVTTGEISGQTLVPGTYPFKVEAANTRGDVKTKDISLLVEPKFCISTPTTLPDATATFLYTVHFSVLFKSDPASVTYSTFHDGGPAGGSFDYNTLTYSITPSPITIGTTYDLTLTVWDALPGAPVFNPSDAIHLGYQEYVKTVFFTVRSP